LHATIAIANKLWITVDNLRERCWLSMSSPLLAMTYGVC
jgi:hypothetical protein